MDISELYQLFIASDGISTDTRKLLPNTLFFALKGASFNGNHFASKALESGCSIAVVDEEEFVVSDKVILVNSVLKTLQDLANYHRRQFDIPVLGITGSNGKTTTKELIGAVLSKKYNLLITQGNLNNHLGVPFTLLNLNKEHNFAVIEMGANKPGDIKELVEIAEPNSGIITNIGAAHIEGFGSLQGVVNTKTELFRFLESVDGTVFYNEKDEVIKNELPKVNNLLSYGEGNGLVAGELIKLNPFVQFKWGMSSYESPEISTKLVGKYNFVNFIAAISVGVEYGVEPDQINEALSEYVPSNNRSQIQKTENNTLVVDCYNANATSMMAALESFVEVETQNKLVVLGDMLELGDISLSEHQKIVDYVSDKGLLAIFIGAEFQKIQTPNEQYLNCQELIDSNKLIDITDSLVLLKGSRSIQLESLIPYL